MDTPLAKMDTMKSNAKPKSSPIETVRRLKSQGKEILAVLAGDIHLSHAMPSARCDSDWYAAMAGQLRQLEHARQEAGMSVPLFVAGDLFDKWNSPPELINFAIEHLPECWAVPGQHDLPHHDWGQIKRSAFWTMVEVRRIKLLEHGKPEVFRGDDNQTNLVAYGFGWGQKIHLPTDSCEISVRLAVIHAYCWVPGKGHPGALLPDLAGKWRRRLKGYSAAVMGDNHCGFLVDNGEGCTILNCGSFMRRRIDEREHRPRIGLLDREGRIHVAYLDCSGDKLVDEAESRKNGGDFGGMIEELKAEGDGALDFAEAVKRHDWKGHGDGVGQYALGLLEGEK